jgi:hypothetical protein
MENKQFKPINTDIIFDTSKADVETFITKIRDIKKAETGHPDTKGIEPKEFKDQFYFEDNGSVWIFINNTWQEFTPI